MAGVCQSKHQKVGALPTDVLIWEAVGRRGTRTSATGILESRNRAHWTPKPYLPLLCSVPEATEKAGESPLPSEEEEEEAEAEAEEEVPLEPHLEQVSGRNPAVFFVSARNFLPPP